MNIDLNTHNYLAIHLYKKVANLFICLALQNGYAVLT